MQELKRIGLCMIVKNEAHIIRRCLENARPLVDYALIFDTGSDDETIPVVRDCLAQASIPGDVVEAPWRDFAHNRSRALAGMRARSDIDYVLMIDADDRIECAPSCDIGPMKAALQADVYNLWTNLGGHSYVRPQLISNRKNFFFKGVLHEYLACEEDFSQATLEGLVVHAVQDGARNCDREKYQKDARTLAAALETENDPFLRSRYTFYLAQSYRDCGDHAAALRHYSARAEQGHWDQEVYTSLVTAGQMADCLERPSAEILDFYSRAYDLCPWRVEALHGAARHCRIKSKFHSGYLFARRGLEIPRPKEGLFLADWIYLYGMLDEFAVIAYWCGRYRESLEACRKLLALDALPDSERPRVEANAKFSERGLDGEG